MAKHTKKTRLNLNDFSFEYEKCVLRVCCFSAIAISLSFFIIVTAPCRVCWSIDVQNRTHCLCKIAANIAQMDIFLYNGDKRTIRKFYGVKHVLNWFLMSTTCVHGGENIKDNFHLCYDCTQFHERTIYTMHWHYIWKPSPQTIDFAK